MSRLLLFVEQKHKPRCIARWGINIRRAFETLLDTSTASHVAIVKADRWWLVLAGDAPSGRSVIEFERNRLPALRLISQHPNKLVIPVPQRRRHPVEGRLIAMGGVQ